MAAKGEELKKIANELKNFAFLWWIEVCCFRSKYDAYKEEAKQGR